MRIRLLAAAVALIPVLGLGLMVTSPAHATQQQICSAEIGGDGLCMNNWNAGNTYVKMYGPNASHEDFEFIFYTGECGGGLVQSTYYGDSRNCPFSNANNDRQFWDLPIGAIEYLPTGQCIGTLTSGTTAGEAYLGACADNNGVGGGTGSTLIYDANPDGSAMDIDRYWSDIYAGVAPCAAGVTDGGSVGANLRMVGTGDTGCAGGTTWI